MSKDLHTIVCPIQRAALLVADVTVIVIVRELRAGPRRFGELLLANLNPRTLSDRLQRLTQEGMVDRTRYAESPPRVEYGLTPKGMALLPVLQALQTFGENWLPVAAAVPDPAPSMNSSDCLEVVRRESDPGAAFDHPRTMTISQEQPPSPAVEDPYQSSR